ncbi:MAG: hypothetical protein M0026_00370 [Nocardiopsaceae bacterium]|nr:hypothetical protein [Nocardiopsaceae bacterium]
MSDYEIIRVNCTSCGGSGKNSDKKCSNCCGQGSTHIKVKEASVYRYLLVIVRSSLTN